MDLIYKNFGKARFRKDFVITPLQITGIFGPSGVGKSTFLRSLAFLETEIEGECWFGDQLLWAKGSAQSPEFKLVKESFGFIFQELFLWNHLTVLQNVSLPAILVKKLSTEAATEQARYLLEVFGLAKYEKQKPTELSGGEAQRVAWARALSLKPKVLFMDEAASALDEKTRQQCLESVAKLVSGISLVIVSHDRSWLNEVCQNVLDFERKNNE